MIKTAMITLLIGMAGGFVISNIAQDNNSPDELLTDNLKSSGTSYTDREIATLKNKISQLQETTSEQAQRIKDLRNIKIVKPRQTAIQNDNSPTTAEATDSLTAEAMQKRINEIKNQIPTLVDNADGAGLVKLFSELKSFGEAGFPQMAAIASILDIDKYRDRKFRGTYNKHEFDKMFPNEIYSWALNENNFEDVGSSFRIRAYYALPYTDIEDIDNLLINSMMKEDSRWALRALERTLKQRPSQENTTLLINALTSNQGINKEARREMEDIIYTMPDDTVDNYIEQQIASSHTEEEKSRLQYVKQRRNPSESGYLINRITEDTQAYKFGLKRGDTIIRYGEYDLKDGMTIEGAKKRMEGNDTVRMTIVRQNGQLLDFEAKPGQIGIDGEHVSKKLNR